MGISCAANRLGSDRSPTTKVDRRMSLAPKGGLSGSLSGGRSESRRPSRALEERFIFYSSMLRHVASTLVLESQRQELLTRADFALLEGVDFYSESCSSEEYASSEEYSSCEHQSVGSD